MLSKARIKFIKSLQLKKYRKQEQCFVVEGGKSVLELLRSDFEVDQLLVTAEFLDANKAVLATFKGETLEVNPSALAEAGEYSTNNAALAVARVKENREPAIANDEFALMLDDIRDPGNLGTIMRIADWYGMKHIIASTETADVYNSKVVQSSMGSFTRINVFYTDLEQYLVGNSMPVFGAFLDGDNVHETKFKKGGILVIGNEANGISSGIEKFVTRKITIPRFGDAESLNAAVATAIICDNIRRR
jgi:TrmH family RNA methyltransferase